MNRERIVGEVAKNAKGDKILVTEILDTESKVSAVDIRLGFLNENDEFILTKKGIRVNSEQFKELKNLINSIEIED